MFSSLRLISLAREASAAAREELMKTLAQSALASRAGTLLAPTCPGVWNGGDLIWRCEYADEAAYRDAESSARFQRETAAALADPARVSRVEHVAFPHFAPGGASPRRGLYRVALFCANQRPTPERLARFASETRSMPDYIRSIRRWQLAIPLEASGSRRWTHVWEQEYDGVAGLHGSYMQHPHHWSHVDRWFDPEDPDWLIDPLLCHSFCETHAPVIGD